MQNLSTVELISQISEVVKKAGQIILGADRSSAFIDEKEGHANFVTSYDKKVQDYLYEELKNIDPEAGFLGEEDENGSAISEGFTFIIDPIDGTTNFIKDYKTSCISVGLFKNHSPFIGVVYNPYLDELFTAGLSEGAYLNGKRIHVSEKSLGEGIVIFGTAPYYSELMASSMHIGYGFLKKAMDVRRSGSAAIDLCSLACGRAEAFFELRLSIWDYAAAAIIVSEAGGVMCSGFGKPLNLDGNKCPVMAFNKPVAEELLNGPKTDYDYLEACILGLSESTEDNGSFLANVAAVIYNELLAINWAGFYLYDKEKNLLNLSSFQGQVACTEIAFGRGVCGTALKEKRTLVVKDVHDFPEHIACDAASASEIVVPIMVNGECVGVLDIDSPIVGRFSEDDAAGLERIVDIIRKRIQ